MAGGMTILRSVFTLKSALSTLLLRNEGQLIA
jgi:hypothetical protein